MSIHKKTKQCCYSACFRWRPYLRVWHVWAGEHTGSGGRRRVSEGRVHVRPRLPLLQHCTPAVIRAAILFRSTLIQHRVRCEAWRPITLFPTSRAACEVWCPALLNCLYSRSVMRATFYITSCSVHYLCHPRYHTRIPRTTLVECLNTDRRRHVIHIKM